MILANLVHLGCGMWHDRPEKMLCEDAEWQSITNHMAARHYNMIVIDLGEGVAWESHPEIGVKGAWSVAKLRAELARLRGMGLEVIPKLNFATTHDTWLGEYGRMVSTPEYYRVCEDLIRETSAIFDKPRFLHIGFDEEDYRCQDSYDYAVMRQGDLWWHDLLWFDKVVASAGMRTWMWADRIWECRDDFLKHMPRHIVQSNWYYDADFGARAFRWPRISAYLDLDKAGFEQIPTCSNFVTPSNAAGTVDFCRKNLNPSRTLGFMQSSWRRTISTHHAANIAAIDLLADAATPKISAT